MNQPHTKQIGLKCRPFRSDKPKFAILLTSLSVIVSSSSSLASAKFVSLRLEIISNTPRPDIDLYNNIIAQLDLKLWIHSRWIVLVANEAPRCFFSAAIYFYIHRSKIINPAVAVGSSSKCHAIGEWRRFISVTFAPVSHASFQSIKVMAQPSSSGTNILDLTPDRVNAAAMFLIKSLFVLVNVEIYGCTYTEKLFRIFSLMTRARVIGKTQRITKELLMIFPTSRTIGILTITNVFDFQMHLA